MMKHSTRAYLVLLSAVAGVSLWGRPASAQMRVDTSGHAMDANTQVGSGGYNQQSTNNQTWAQYQNALVTNSDSGGYGFRGRSFDGVNLGVGYTDPFAFRGLLAGEGVDQFISISTGVPTMSNPTASSSNYGAPPSPSGIFYGSANHAAPPAGFQSIPNVPGYVPAQPTLPSTVDTRLGTIDFSGNSQIIPKPYEMILPGPVDPTANPATAQQQMLAANPIYGVVNWSMTPENQQGQNQNSILGQSPLQQGITMQMNQGLTQQQISNLRQQVANQAANSSTNQANATSSGAAPLSPLQPGGKNNQPLGQVYSTGSQLSNSSLSPTAGNVSTDQYSRQLPTGISLPAPAQQSAQFARLRKAIQDYNATHTTMNDAQANLKFQQILRLRDQANQAAEGGANVLPGPANGSQGTPSLPAPGEPGLPPGGSLQTPPVQQPNFNTAPGNLGPGPSMGVPPDLSPAPVPIDKFSKDIPAKGLADLVAGGDVDLEKGQYDKAIAAYNQAIDVVPNNPLILMARGIAELGGGYYGQANTDIHLAISEDPAVLMGQYNLNKQLGPQRLKQLISDLKSIATSSQDNTLHAFLLTFCFYNSGHLGQAAEWLQTTDQRSGGQDPAVLQMKKYWNFSDEAVPATRPSH